MQWRKKKQWVTWVAYSHVELKETLSSCNSTIVEWDKAWFSGCFAYHCLNHYVMWNPYSPLAFKLRSTLGNLWRWSDGKISNRVNYPCGVEWNGSYSKSRVGRVKYGKVFCCIYIYLAFKWRINYFYFSVSRVELEERWNELELRHVFF